VVIALVALRTYKANTYEEELEKQGARKTLERDERGTPEAHAIRAAGRNMHKANMK